MIIKNFSILCLISMCLTACQRGVHGVPDPAYELKQVLAVNWTPLNRARGDKSPKAATLWGDRTKDQATGFLVEFMDGFESPPHIHNVTYRGIVIEGLVHNDDPDALPLWMSSGSYWTQPAGGLHVTSAKGARTMAYIEIEKGPYLVKPPEQAFETQFKPLNIDASNLVWLHVDDVWKDASNNNPGEQSQVAFLWGEPLSDTPSGILLRISTGHSLTIKNHSPKSLRIVSIRGELSHQLSAVKQRTLLAPGSYIGLGDDAMHRFSCDSQQACWLYIRSEGRFELSH